MSLTKEECERALSDLEMANNYPTSKYNDSRLIDFCLDTFQQLIEEYFEITKEKECLEKALDKTCGILSNTELKTTCDDKFKECKENHCIGRNCVYSRPLTKEEWKELCMKDVE